MMLRFDEKDGKYQNTGVQIAENFARLGKTAYNIILMYSTII